MPAPHQKLAESLQALKALQDRGVVAIRASDLTRTHRERLHKAGFLKEVMKGWYIPARPDEKAGETTAWYASFWDFCAAYLRERFSDDWSLAPEQSLLLHAGNRTVPRQLVVRAPRARNRATPLAHETSVFDVRASLPEGKDRVERDGLILFSLPAALVASSPAIYKQQPIDVRTALATIADASEVLDVLLRGDHSVIAGRLAGAFRNIGRDRIADEIIRTMKAAGYAVRENDPFNSPFDADLPRRDGSPYAGRIRLMWQEMREPAIAAFPDPPGPPNDVGGYLKRVEEAYLNDAYHSLSIEGYRVSVEMIERVRAGAWSPDTNEHDRELSNALAARGYWQAFQSVKASVKRVLENQNAGLVADHDHGEWYRQLFAPSVTAGIIPAASLAGYRDGQVYIRNSMHVPLPTHAVRDVMPVFFEILQHESDPRARVVLGHFIFVYIHPYMDGNGRMGRFLMNLMLASGGYPWTIIPVQQRNAYMAALEEASVRQNIRPFSRFLADLVQQGLEGKVVATLPEAGR